MALRFRRRVSLFPGVRLNVGKRGVSVSSGIRGANLTLGRHGLFGNVGLPGSGLSYRARLDDSGRRDGRGSQYGRDREQPPVDVRVTFAEDGRLQLRDADGNELPARLVRLVRDEHAATLRRILEQERDARNGGIERLLNLHLETPREPVRFAPESFEAPRPRAPELCSPGLLGFFFRSRREAIERLNRQRAERHRRQVDAWEVARAAHRANEIERAARFRRAQQCEDAEAMAELLETRLADLDWPRETEVCYDIDEDCATVVLDVALPSQDEMPAEEAAIAARGLKLNIREKSATQRRKEYARHVHAALFRVTGEVFATLPALDRVIVSGFVSRPDPATGQEDEAYLISVVVEQEAWDRLDLCNLQAIDPIACFEQFELRRDMTRTGILREVEVFSAAGISG